MDPEEAVGRSGAFAMGHGGVGLTPSLQQSSAMQNAQAPHQFTPTSVLQQYIASPNGMSGRDSERRLLGGGFLPTSNGMSDPTTTAARMITSKYMNV